MQTIHLQHGLLFGDRVVDAQSLLQPGSETSCKLMAEVERIRANRKARLGITDATDRNPDPDPKPVISSIVTTSTVTAPSPSAIRMSADRYKAFTYNTSLLQQLRERRNSDENGSNPPVPNLQLSHSQQTRPEIQQQSKPLLTTEQLRRLSMTVAPSPPPLPHRESVASSYLPPVPSQQLYQPQASREKPTYSTATPMSFLPSTPSPFTRTYPQATPMNAVKQTQQQRVSLQQLSHKLSSLYPSTAVAATTPLSTSANTVAPATPIPTATTTTPVQTPASEPLLRTRSSSVSFSAPADFNSAKIVAMLKAGTVVKFVSGKGI